MRGRRHSLLLVLIAAVVLALTSGCRKAKAVSTSRPSDGGTTQGNIAPDVRMGLPAPIEQAGLVGRVHFAFDSSTLDAAARETVAGIGAELRGDVSLRIVIEGHADERGSTQYNLALSDRRAAAVSRFLVDMGIDAGRITTVAFGKERPLDEGHDERAWARNRRCDLLIPGKAGRVAEGR